MQKTTTKHLSEHTGESVELRGWINRLRAQGKIVFLHLRDGDGVVQCILKAADLGPERVAELQRAGQEASVIVRGTVNPEPRAPGGFEIHADQAEIVSPTLAEYPITPKEHGIDFLLSIRHLWLRSSKQHAVLRVRNELAFAIRDFFYTREFVNVDAPIFTPSSCEGTSDLFEVSYFEDKVYLTQSGQLYMEAAAAAHGKVYCFGPTFRAERSKTRRHLTEFWMVEPEMAWAGLNDAMDLAEEFLEAIVARVLERCQEELKILERDTAPLERVRRPFPRIRHSEGAALLAQKGIPFEPGSDFGAPEETAISESFDRPVIVNRYPAAIKAFYMRRDPEDESLALCADVIAPEGFGEIIGGGERAVDYDFLIDQIRHHKLPQQAFEWYLDLRRYGSVPHAGFGLGLERTLAWICNRPHIRETIPFPRTPYRKDP